MRKISISGKREAGLKEKTLYAFFVLLSLDFFDCIPLKDTFDLPIIKQILGGTLSIICIPTLMRKRSCFFKYEYLLICLSFLLCSISSYILYGQDAYQSLKQVVCYMYPLSFYLLALKYNFDNKYISLYNLKRILFQILCYH